MPLARTLKTVGAVVGIALLAGCSTAVEDASSTTPTTASAAPQQTTGAPTASSSPTSSIQSPPDTATDDAAACTAFGEEDFRLGFGAIIDTAGNSLSAYLTNTTVGYRPIAVTAQAASSEVGRAVTEFNKAVSGLGSPGTLIKAPQAAIFAKAYKSAVDQCTAAGHPVTPAPGSTIYQCTQRESTASKPSRVILDNYQQVWSIVDQLTTFQGTTGPCTIRVAAPYNETQTAAIAATKAAYESPTPSDDATILRSLYQLCTNPAEAGPYFAPGTTAPLGRETAEAIGMLTICPDHPNAEKVRNSVNIVTTELDGRSDGVIVDDGKHLVGTDLQPGTWQTKSDAVHDCYWEITDATGEIIDNQFINVAPKLTIEIPATAAGFTTRGCGPLVKIG